MNPESEAGGVQCRPLPGRGRVPVAGSLFSFPFVCCQSFSLANPPTHPPTLPPPPPPPHTPLHLSIKLHVLFLQNVCARGRCAGVCVTCFRPFRCSLFCLRHRPGLGLRIDSHFCDLIPIWGEIESLQGRIDSNRFESHESLIRY